MFCASDKAKQVQTLTDWWWGFPRLRIYVHAHLRIICFPDVRDEVGLQGCAWDHWLRPKTEGGPRGWEAAGGCSGRQREEPWAGECAGSGAVTLAPSGDVPLAQSRAAFHGVATAPSLGK